MAYTRTHWINNLTQLNAKNMNNIEDGIEEQNDAISELDGKVQDLDSKVTDLKASRVTYSDPDDDGNIVIISIDV